MTRLFAWGFAGVLVAGGASLMVVNAQQRPNMTFIVGDGPVTEEQVRVKLQTDGWSDVRIYRDGRTFKVTGSKAGESRKLAVDAQTGRVRANDDNDDDDDD